MHGTANRLERSLLDPSGDMSSILERPHESHHVNIDYVSVDPELLRLKTLKSGISLINLMLVPVQPQGISVTLVDAASYFLKGSKVVCPAGGCLQG
eukprot:5630099-Pyramimonas_sp.AAC.1